MDKYILTLARAVRDRPHDELALGELVRSLRGHDELSAFAALVECWARVRADAPKPEHALAGLLCQLATRAQPEAARLLARSALDLVPHHIDALTLFEQHVRDNDLGELCDRYTAFLAHAPFHTSSPRMRVKLIDRLVEAGRYDEAMQQVLVLPPPSSISPVHEDIERACAIVPHAATRVSREDDEDPWEHTLVLHEDEIHFVA